MKRTTDNGNYLSSGRKNSTVLSASIITQGGKYAVIQDSKKHSELFQGADG